MMNSAIALKKNTIGESVLLGKEWRELINGFRYCAPLYRVVYLALSLTKGAQ